MFSKKYRLSVKEFENTIKKGKSYSSKFFFLKLLKNNYGVIKIGVAVSKKLAPKSAQKNYYKRILRHLLKESCPKTSVHYNVILTAKENIKNVKFNDLKQDAIELLQKTELHK
ncbi:MAG: ribonuclease P protein component [Candidatus Spechtbacteria bacterium RIFCSPLOWO2_02_FULL_38_8]|uniref:Ribonuclease P protein component n=1 Tax=Candidatus Spechtbacteria bacterium RIFCSPLOWO2_02_FULL_38_8 TaxID=1802164 RepID=A0A1G2HME8_9BACT|nr:MAG: ribonuclease P protein component [Candidatus Spechtbacteria bacterium RIFCSPLOWO2_02_FULL_38_8]